jgi:predicted secreted protein
LIALVHGVVLFGTFAILWFLALFCLLPVGMGSEVDADTGAPLSPRLGLKVLVAGGIAVVLWLIFYLLIALKILDL